MIDCTEVRLSLGAHALGALDPEESAEIETHLADCPACRRIVRRLKVEIGFLRSSVRSGFRPTPHSWAGRPIYGES